MTNEAVLLSALSSGATIKPDFQPQNNKQAYLAYLNGLDISLPEPRTVEEVLLYNLCLNGGSSGGGAGENKLSQRASGSLAELTAADLAGATIIVDYAFYKCTSLKNATIPGSVSSVGANSFQSCTSLESVALLDGVQYIGINAFNGCSSLVDVELPDSLLDIGNYAFNGCKAMEDITIPDSVTNIGMYAFTSCSALKRINIPGSVNGIGTSTFVSCTGLMSVVIRNGVKSIGDRAFNNCTSLTNIRIPESVTQIGPNALTFGSTTNKATITFSGETPPSITANTFDTSKLEKIVVPAGCGNAYKTASVWSGFADYIEEEI